MRLRFASPCGVFGLRIQRLSSSRSEAVRFNLECVGRSATRGLAKVGGAQRTRKHQNTPQLSRVEMGHSNYFARAGSRGSAIILAPQNDPRLTD